MSVDSGVKSKLKSTIKAALSNVLHTKGVTYSHIGTAAGAAVDAIHNEDDLHVGPPPPSKKPNAAAAPRKRQPRKKLDVKH